MSRRILEYEWLCHDIEQEVRCTVNGGSGEAGAFLTCCDSLHCQRPRHFESASVMADAKCVMSNSSKDSAWLDAFHILVLVVVERAGWPPFARPTRRAMLPGLAAARKRCYKDDGSQKQAEQAMREGLRR